MSAPATWNPGRGAMGTSAGQFPTTMLSVIAGAGSGDAAVRKRCLDAVAGLYYKPVYLHLRLKWRMSVEDAQDLTQGFFARALEKDYLADYEPARGRFRTFLRVCVDRFAGNERAAGRRHKRGGGAALASLDFDVAEAELAARSPAEDPERIFDDAWRRELFTLAIAELRASYESSGRGEQLRAFERYDLRDDDERLTYAELARELEKPVTTITNWLSSARRELRRHVLAKLAEVTGNEEEYRSEARVLFGVEAG